MIMTDLTLYYLELPERYKLLHFATLFASTQSLWLHVMLCHRHSKHHKALILLQQVKWETFSFVIPFFSIIQTHTGISIYLINPGGTGDQESSCQCRRCKSHRPDPWSGWEAPLEKPMATLRFKAASVSSRSQPRLHRLAQGLAHQRCSISICQMNTQMNEFSHVP